MDDRSQFRSGDFHLDRYFREYAGQNQFKHSVGVTYVAVDEGHIFGYATIAPGHLEVEDLPAPSARICPAIPCLSSGSRVSRLMSLRAAKDWASCSFSTC